MPDRPPISPKRIDLYLLRAPTDKPVKTAFATMTARPALLVRVEDAEGAAGWGEIWCNHPPFTGAHRLDLASEIMAPRTVGGIFDGPEAATAALERATRVLALQCADFGAHAQVLAGFDTAFWDLAARRVNLPLYRLLSNGADGPAAGDGDDDAPITVPAYASGINPDDAAVSIRRARAGGFHAFKVKIGFDAAADLAAIAGARDVLGPGDRLMMDANQAWDLETAQGMAAALAPFGADWLEEPLAVDAPEADWAALARTSEIPLAGGENLFGAATFATAIDAGHLAVIQPDVAKWGGVSGCLAMARQALAGGRRYCPHFLGAAVGLAASAHLLAAAGGDGLLEVDVNRNPLREDICDQALNIADGVFHLPAGPGLGLTPEEGAFGPYLISHRRIE